MEKTQTTGLAARRRWKFQRWSVCATALLSFAAGSLVTARLKPPAEVSADSNRVFELMIYHTVPGKEPALEAIFRDVSKLQAKHGLNVIGYWVPDHGVHTNDSAWNDTFIYLVVHPGMEEAKKNWHALHTDPEFPPYRKAAEPLIKKVDDHFMVDEVYMHPTDFSGMK